MSEVTTHGKRMGKATASGISSCGSSGAQKLERKRRQNRVAQHKYRQTQKERIRALESALAQSTIQEPLPSLLRSHDSPLRTSSGFPGSSSENATSATQPVKATIYSLPIASAETASISMDPTIRTLPSSFGCDFAYEPLQPDWAADFGTDNLLSPISASSGRGTSALHIAVSKSDESMVQLLLERGADVDKRDQHGRTVLHVAAEAGDENMIGLLLEGSADPNLTDSAGRTALFAAVIGGSESVVKLLLSHVADINATDCHGLVPLHVAVESGLEAITLLLLANGANIDA